MTFLSYFPEYKHCAQTHRLSWMNLVARTLLFVGDVSLVCIFKNVLHTSGNLAVFHVSFTDHCQSLYVLVCNNIFLDPKNLKSLWWACLCETSSVFTSTSITVLSVPYIQILALIVCFLVIQDTLELEKYSAARRSRFW